MIFRIFKNLQIDLIFRVNFGILTNHREIPEFNLAMIFEFFPEIANRVQIKNLGIHPIYKRQNGGVWNGLTIGQALILLSCPYQKYRYRDC